MGSVLAENIFALDDLPPFPASVMDGYAVSDLEFSEVFSIVEIKMLAGADPSVKLDATQKKAVYVTTGGPVPAGFVAVVPVEECIVEGRTLDLRGVDKSQYKEGTWIRAVGSDIKKDQVVLAQGTVLRSAEFGLLATIGCVENVKVYTEIVNIGVLSTGDELVSAGIERLPKGKIRDSNKIMLMSIIRESCSQLNLSQHVNLIDLGIIKDDWAKIDITIMDAIDK